MNYLIALAIFLAMLFFSSCNPFPAAPFLEGMCVHPAVAGGTPFSIPKTGRFNRFGALVVDLPDNGGRLTLVGAACVFQEGGAK